MGPEDKARELDLRRQAQIQRQRDSIDRLLTDPSHAPELIRLNNLLAWRDSQIGRILAAISGNDSAACRKVREIAKEQWPA